MANQTNSLAHTKWLCKYHIVFCPKYRRKIIYNQYQADLREIIRTLCKVQGSRNHRRKHDVSTVGLNERTIKKYIEDQEKHDIALDKLSVREYQDPFKGSK